MILACYDVYYQNWGLEGKLAFSYIDAEKFVFINSPEYRKLSVCAEKCILSIRGCLVSEIISDTNVPCFKPWK